MCKEKEEEKNKLVPERYRIDKEEGFLYTNDKKTNYIAKSGFLGDKKDIKELGENDVKNCKYFDYLGQYFCCKEIKLENENKSNKKMLS